MVRDNFPGDADRYGACQESSVCARSRIGSRGRLDRKGAWDAAQRWHHKVTYFEKWTKENQLETNRLKRLVSKKECLFLRGGRNTRRDTTLDYDIAGYQAWIC
jgi:hypothetical protein